MKKFTAIFAGLMFVALAGCNTVAGVGKDVEKVGEKTQEVSKKASNKIDEKPACTATMQTNCTVQKK